MSILRVLLWPLRNKTLPEPPPSAPMALNNKSESDPYAAVEYEGQRVYFCTPNAGTAWRVQTLFTKEPDTIEWISGFSRGDVLVDIGANVGMYTIWAARTRGVRVYAFEPESQNYALLNKNIYANQLVDRVTAYGIALSDHTGFSLLHLGQFMAGGSCHTFDEKFDFKLEPLNPVFSQGCYATTLDKMVKTGVIPAPTHIKIDVDGLEHKVLAGGKNTLADPGLKSILIEINQNLALHRDIVEEMRSFGFSYDQNQVNESRRKEGAFKGVGNYVFKR